MSGETIILAVTHVKRDNRCWHRVIISLCVRPLDLLPHALLSEHVERIRQAILTRSTIRINVVIRGMSVKVGSDAVTHPHCDRG